MLKKLSRRRFFAAAAGAAAAPALSQSVQQFPALPPPAMPSDYGHTVAECTGPTRDPMYVARERARLEAIARGDMQEYHVDQIEMSRADSRREAAAENIAALRSVSASAKRLMYAEHLAESRKRSFMGEATRELRRLLRAGW